MKEAKTPKRRLSRETFFLPLFSDLSLLSVSSLAVFCVVHVYVTKTKSMGILEMRKSYSIRPSSHNVRRGKARVSKMRLH